MARTIKRAKKKEEKPDQYVLAFDPGGTTGMALVRYNDRETALVLLAQIEDGHMGFYDNLLGTPGGLGTPITVVSEKWVEHGAKGVDRTPLVIEGIQYAFWPDQTIYQTPDMKQIIPDERLKELGVWTEGKPHQMDALRHALIYLWQQMHQPTLEMLGEGNPMPKDGEEADGVESGAGNRGGEPGDGEIEVEVGETSDGGADDESLGEGDGKDAIGAIFEVIQYQMDQEEADELAALYAQAEKVYQAERDLDGAFAGYQADAKSERRTLIEEDF